MSNAPSIPLDQMILAYLDDLQIRGYKPKTIAGYRKTLLMFVRWAATAHAPLLRDFSADLVKAYIRYLQAKTKWSERQYRHPSPEHVSPTAVRNYVRDLKTFSAWLAAEQYTAEPVLASVRVPKADETPVDPLSDDELDQLFGSLNTSDPFDLRDYVLLHTLWDTGMRVGELVALTFDDLDLNARQIRVQHAKFGKWRDIGFGLETHKYLKRYLALGRPQPAITGDQHVFLSLDGYPLREGTVQKICSRLSKRTGIHVHCHRFRHTFAVNMLRAGTDLRTLQRLMGHADIRVLARYLNLASDEAIRAHQTNSPADRHHQQRHMSRSRLPLRRRTQF